MAEIKILDPNTIDKIAAGEVVERPQSIIKELLENSIDAGATNITVEIKEGGISFLRVTDNGNGIEKEQVSKAFLRHATSKITCVEDLHTISSLGFRGEALSSISAVSKVEMITKTSADLTGIRIVIEGGIQKEMEEVGAPQGTTIVVRNIFYNTPARAKFLKSPQTEAGYITDLLEHLALSRPDISFKYLVNQQLKFHTSGNGNVKEIIYRIFGRETADSLIEINQSFEDMSISGFIGNPLMSRASRNGENYLVNMRYVKSDLIAKAIETGYHGFLMQHKFPFCVLYFQMNPQKIDVNVHPTKMEVRFSNQEEFMELVRQAIYFGLHTKELIPSVSVVETQDVVIEKKVEKLYIPEPFEEIRIEHQKLKEDDIYVTNLENKPFLKEVLQNEQKGRLIGNQSLINTSNFGKNHAAIMKANEYIYVESASQMHLFEEEFIEQQVSLNYKILGQLFDTYWLLAFEDKLFIVDQHAAHEKVKYEHLLEHFKMKDIQTQTLFPPVVISLHGREESMLLEYLDYFRKMGFEIEEFGGNEYAIRQIPMDLYGSNPKDLFYDILNEVANTTLNLAPELIYEKLASMSCKAAVKGNTALSEEEFKVLMDQLLVLENPYHCPHGRPTIISMTKYEIEKKFKRIV